MAATWTLTTEATRYIFDNGAGHQFIVHRHIEHWHAEELYPYDQDGAGRTSPEAIRDDFKTYLEGLGDSVQVV